MCVVSMVHDHYQDKFPGIWPDVGGPGAAGSWPYKPAQQDQPPIVIGPTVDLVELRKLIDEFKAAVEAAKTVDRLTGQPDCVDPEKAKLQERVDRLEKWIDVLLAKTAR